MKHKPVSYKTPKVIRCPKCQTDDVAYNPQVVSSTWEGGREVTQTGQYICMNPACVYRWHQAAPEA